MIEALIGTISVLLFLVIYLITIAWDRHKIKKEFKNTRWCVISHSTNSHLGAEKDLIDYILRLQYELSIKENYRIKIDECDEVGKVLQDYQYDLIQRYFNGTLLSYNCDSKEFFFKDLFEYFKTLEYQNKLKKAIPHYKMYYILYVYYLKANNIVDNNKLGVIQANNIKESIDNMLSSN